MKDGNKESSKELLSTLRAIVAISITLLVFSSNRNLLSLETNLEANLYVAFFIILLLSVAISIYVCLIIISKLHSEIEDIIFQDDVHKSSFVALVLFIIGCGILISIQIM